MALIRNEFVVVPGTTVFNWLIVADHLLLFEPDEDPQLPPATARLHELMGMLEPDRGLLQIVYVPQTGLVAARHHQLMEAYIEECTTSETDGVLHVLELDNGHEQSNIERQNGKGGKHRFIEVLTDSRFADGDWQSLAQGIVMEPIDDAVPADQFETFLSGLEPPADDDPVQVSMGVIRPDGTGGYTLRGFRVKAF